MCCGVLAQNVCCPLLSLNNSLFTTKQWQNNRKFLFEKKNLMLKMWLWHQNFDRNVSKKVQSHSRRVTGFGSKDFLSQVSSCKNIFSFSASPSTTTNSAMFTARTWNAFFISKLFLIRICFTLCGEQKIAEIAQYEYSEYAIAEM